MPLTYFDASPASVVRPLGEQLPLMQLPSGDTLASWLTTDPDTGNSILTVQIRDAATGIWGTPITVLTASSPMQSTKLRLRDDGGLDISYQSSSMVHFNTTNSEFQLVGAETTVVLPASTGPANAVQFADGTFVFVESNIVVEIDDFGRQTEFVVTTATALGTDGQPSGEAVEVARFENYFDIPEATAPDIELTPAGSLQIISYASGDDFEFSSSGTAVVTEVSADLTVVSSGQELPREGSRTVQFYGGVTTEQLAGGGTLYTWSGNGGHFTIGLPGDEGFVSDAAFAITNRVTAREATAAALPAGGFLIVTTFSISSGQRGGIVATHFDAEGTRIEDIWLNVLTPTEARSVSASVTATGQIVVQWEQVIDGVDGVRERILEPDLSFAAFEDGLDNDSIYHGDLIRPHDELAFMGGGDDEFNGNTGDDTLFAGAGNDIGRGGDGMDSLDGGVGSDTLHGDSGDDTLNGGAGDDSLDGGADADFLIGGQGSDTIIVDDADDRVAESRSWTGTDHVFASVDFRMGRQHIENLTLTGEARLGAGNGLMNEIRGNRADNVLDGGKNNDTLYGGAGNDTYLVRAPGDLVIEAAGRGTADTVLAFRAYALTDNVERLFLQTLRNDAGEGITGVNGIGNASANTIVGNPFDNVIIGREGSDTLKGQGGADTFVFDRAIGADNIDRIIDFDAAEGDLLKFKQAEFATVARGALDAAAFINGTAAADAGDRFIFDQAAGRLFFDIDGTGSLAQQLVATFDGGAVVTASDIEIF